MTVEDITLNIFIPPETEKVTVQPKVLGLKNRVNSSRDKKHESKPKVVKALKCQDNVSPTKKVFVTGNSSESKSKPLEIPAKRTLEDLNQDAKKNWKKFKKNPESKKVVKDKKTTVSRECVDVLNVPMNDNVVPIQEPLFSCKTFESISSLHPHLVANLSQLFGITTMTVVQQITIPELLSRKDALIRSQTGSGKTLAYAVPVVNFLQAVRPKISRSDGVKALIVLPTRELALQTYECFQKLVRAFTWLVPGLLVGGEKRKSEKARLRKGINILIGTPGRILDHSRKTSALSLTNVNWLILDEADKLLDLGYEEAIRSILETLQNQLGEDSSKSVEAVLLSATLTPGVERLAGLALDSPVRLDASESADNSHHISDDVSTFVIPQTLDQKYIIVPAKLRLVLLAAIIIHHSQMENTNKLLIFMATQDMVNFYADLLTCLQLKNIVFFKLHGHMTQVGRTEVFNKFRSSVSGVLLCTDVVARGLDLPKTDVIIQYNAPSTPTDYVHRVGRTARVGLEGESILFLEHSEMNFIHLLNENRIKLREQDMEQYLKVLVEVDIDEKLSLSSCGSFEEAAGVLRNHFEDSLINDKDLHEMGCKAYQSWVRFYASYPKESRTIFCFKQLHLGHHAKSFALTDAPSRIGKIGKSTYLQKKNQVIRKSKNKIEKLKVPSMSDRNRKLIISEFDSGLKFKRKNK